MRRKTSETNKGGVSWLLTANSPRPFILFGTGVHPQTVSRPDMRIADSASASHLIHHGDTSPMQCYINSWAKISPFIVRSHIRKKALYCIAISEIRPIVTRIRGLTHLTLFGLGMSCCVSWYTGRRPTVRGHGSSLCKIQRGGPDDTRQVPQRHSHTTSGPRKGVRGHNHPRNKVRHAEGDRLPAPADGDKF